MPAHHYRDDVLLVDGSPADLCAAIRAVSPNYRIKALPSAASLMERIATSGPPRVILLDAEDNGAEEALGNLEMDPVASAIPVILLTKGFIDDSAAALAPRVADILPKDHLEALGRIKIESRLEAGRLLERLEEQAARLKDQHEELGARREALRAAVEERTGRAIGVQRAVLDTVARMIGRPEESESGAPGGHDIGVLFRALDERGLHAETRRWDKGLMVQASKLHDVGKLAINEAILLKPDKLTRSEFETVKRHTILGVEMLSRIDARPVTTDFLRHARVFAGTHHERWDGSGYPAGLSGEDIPLAGRLMAIADVYEGLTSDRPHKKAVSHETAVRVIIQGKGAQFDPTLVDVFAQVADQFAS